MVSIVVPGSNGIPKWVSYQRMGSEIRIELPMNWYEDDKFLGFALFFFHVLVDDDVYERIVPCLEYGSLVSGLKWELISHDDQSEQLENIRFYPHCKKDRIKGSSFDSGSTTDPAIWVVYFPQMAIPSNYRSRRWNYFKAHFHTHTDCASFSCGDDTFKVESCGIHLIYDQDQNSSPPPSRESSGDTKLRQYYKKRSFSPIVITNFSDPNKVYMSPLSFFFFCDLIKRPFGNLTLLQILALF